MKKILFAAAAIAALFASCDKNDETINSVIPEAADGARIAITLTGASDTETRAFFDTTAKAEAWESSLSSLSVFAFDKGGTLIVRRDFSSAELASKSATFALPKSTAGTECSFYAVANYDASSAKTRAALTALVENSAATYNGTFAEVSTAAKRSGGFVMSGSVTKTVGAVNTTTSVGITLKRTVAKVAVQTTVDPSFANKYSGTLAINSVKLSKAASQSLVVAGTPTPGTMTFSHMQTPAAASENYNALFYCFENGALAVGNRVLLEINATYDSDGSASTPDDRSEVTYSIELTGKATGEILRNGYYRLAANITGLVGQDCAVTVTVADWETPVTQNVELGA
ncbi:FimB/Mfa2 family fimbrial subunit [Alistipes finegoldii]|uniref:FimB/Mfa2 family fimbrial subunit n=1 Tax=Alistipes finegoldii TaxID=214856 RepID=UPI00242BDF88|nr:FimB/Mfa2 family fimbrial subunit [Alistipes finegoldii]